MTVITVWCTDQVISHALFCTSVLKAETSTCIRLHMYWLQHIISVHYYFNRIGNKFDFLSSILQEKKRKSGFILAQGSLLVSKRQGKDWLILPILPFHYSPDSLVNTSMICIVYISDPGKMGNVVVWSLAPLPHGNTELDKWKLMDELNLENKFLTFKPCNDMLRVL